MRWYGQGRGLVMSFDEVKLTKSKKTKGAGRLALVFYRSRAIPNIFDVRPSAGAHQRCGSPCSRTGAIRLPYLIPSPRKRGLGGFKNGMGTHCPLSPLRFAMGRGRHRLTQEAGNKRRILPAAPNTTLAQHNFRQCWKLRKCWQKTQHDFRKCWQKTQHDFRKCWQKKRSRSRAHRRKQKLSRSRARHHKHFPSRPRHGGAMLRMDSGRLSNYPYHTPFPSKRTPYAIRFFDPLLRRLQSKLQFRKPPIKSTGFRKAPVRAFLDNATLIKN